MRKSTERTRILVSLLAIAVLLWIGYGGLQPAHMPAFAQGQAATKQGTMARQAITSAKVNPDRPVLAFFYPWYRSADWCLCHMSALPTVQYNSADEETIDGQVRTAASAGITGFISSFWGINDQTDKNLAKVLTHAAQLEQETGYHFASTIYFESDSPAMQGTTAIVNNLRYVLSRYASDPHFLHWRGKPVLFFWDPLGHGRTIAMWNAVRQQVDPENQVWWSAEGVDMHLLDVFDGIHLFSAGYWGILHNTMPAVDQHFRALVNAYNARHHTHKIWAAGVMPGYDDTRVPGRQGTFIVPRNHGKTYRISWGAALTSAPDWITITSYNEWFEGSMIEPSPGYTTLYLSLTRQYAQSWHG